ncbi:probable RNA-dependent RNA polymerase 1 [Selaginella moellendorffii]|uniref:probable RNA-dependent RNA polymerase 1 n=1 Tax=Selaginella moellendorffii TaxID=88036 RepID=UPI000D1C51FE|nr:probable RNA-dependent RNA polymerase 1 [Selaginella moellendorffii]|eukprot:XP_024517545.1 probable RNA-dependent RNA polymerase 1 [Selaginella moellendorffii]
MEAYVGNVSKCAVASELVECLESVCGRGTVVSCSIDTAHANWMSRGYAFVQFATAEASQLASQLAAENALLFYGRALRIQARKAVTHGPIRGDERVEGIVLTMGFARGESGIDCLWSCSGVAAEFCFGSCQLNLLLQHDGVDYKLELLFRNLRFVDAFVETSQASHLLLQLFRPPLVFQGLPSPSEQGNPVLDTPLAILRHFKAVRSNSYNYKYSKFAKEPTWTRSTDFTPGKAISQSLVYCLEFPSDLSDEQALKISKSLSGYDTSSMDRALTLVAGESYALQQELSPILSITEDDGAPLPFDIVYKINFLVQSGYMSPASVTRELFTLLQGFPEKLCLSALDKLVSPAGNVSLDAFSTIESYLKCHHRRSELVEPDGGYTYVKRLVVTPTKVYCTGPELERSNGVTRRYKDFAANFLRVSFVDENFETLYADAVRLPTKVSVQIGLLPEPSSVYHRVLAVVRDGVTIGGKKFKFLGFSASQLREHSLWMFADAGSVTAESIRAWMGDFGGFTNIAKCAARIGQSFSSSRSSLEVLEDELSSVEDIYCGTRYCFSDGVGKISKAFATSVARACNMPVVLSALQIRYAGYKGVVAVDPTCSTKLSLRPSMLKFPSERTGLDVLKASQYAPYYLNRQSIILMTTLGVPDEVFERMQKEELKILDEMLSDPQTAIEVLRSSSSGGEAHSIMVAMLQAGYKPAHEPFLRRLLDNFRSLQLYLLRTKSRIYVPKGRCLLGCLDETGVLDYGQVFVQVSPTPGTRRVVDDGLDDARPRRGVTRSESACVVLGKVVVTKNPCLHPGDLLVLEAVDVPGLHHMIDCVVFPQRGKRPHPNECSGSDLDGDLYFVTWDKSLVPPVTHEPMDYEPGTAAKLDHSVTLEEIQRFFVDSMVHDSLGVISNAHLVHADKELERAKDPKCLELARLASTAVDFAKTGIPAVIPVDLRPRDYPDFMENEFKSTYTSQSVLGKLYRSLQSNGRIFSQRSSAVAASPKEMDQEFDRSLTVDGYEQHVSEARSLKELYDTKLERLLRHYEITEAEIVTGNVLCLGKANEKTKRNDTRDRIACAMKSLAKEAGRWFEAGLNEHQLAKACAWYHVTYHPEFRKGSNVESLSFPWVVPAVVEKLVSLKRAKSWIE